MRKGQGEISYYLVMMWNNSYFVIKQERGVFVIKAGESLLVEIN
jgi:hypothetical protein